MTCIVFPYRIGNAVKLSQEIAPTYSSHRVSSNTLFPCQLSHEVSRRFVIAKLETRFALCVTGTLLDRLPLCGGFLIWSFADPRSEMSALVSEKRDGKTLDLYDH
jgi:hypothetical protein